MSSTPRRGLTIDDPIAPVNHDAHAERLPNTTEGDRAGAYRLRQLDVHPNPNQPRKHFDERSLNALAESTRERGVLQPVIVTPKTCRHV
jgi:hypothetical protein